MLRACFAAKSRVSKIVRFSSNFDSLGRTPIITIIHTRGNIGYAPVSFDAYSTYYGPYFSDTFDITHRLSLTVGGCLNAAMVEMTDQLGTSPDLNGNHTFTRFNPVFGFTYSNRAPTSLNNVGIANQPTDHRIEMPLQPFSEYGGGEVQDAVTHILDMITNMHCLVYRSTERHRIAYLNEAAQTFKLDERE